MEKYEYIKCFWKYIDDVTPVLLFYEVDLENERYATRMVEVFGDGCVRRVIEKGFEFVTEAAVPQVDEINSEPEFFAQIISKNEFEKVYDANKYFESITPPFKKFR